MNIHAVDDSWKRQLRHGPLLSRMANGKRAERHCLNYLKQAIGEPVRWPGVESGNEARRATDLVKSLSAGEFRMLLQRLGLCLKAPCLAKLVAGDQLTLLIGHFGLDVYRAALRLGLGWTGGEALPHADDTSHCITPVEPEVLGQAGCQVFLCAARGAPTDWLVERLLQIPVHWLHGTGLPGCDIPREPALELLAGCSRIGEEVPHESAA